jgi:hypothetical protein
LLIWVERHCAQSKIKNRKSKIENLKSPRMSGCRSEVEERLPPFSTPLHLGPL